MTTSGVSAAIATSGGFDHFGQAGGGADRHGALADHKVAFGAEVGRVAVPLLRGANRDEVHLRARGVSDVGGETEPARLDGGDEHFGGRS